MALQAAENEPAELPAQVFARPAPWPGCNTCRGMDQEWVWATTPGHPRHNPTMADVIVGVMRQHQKIFHERVTE
ncbi:hypothetical protein [Streptomyces sp. NPDC018967]|uniref:hypothetical protein n=1 Tax=Streptomyces sp. NPDC018967 TaxID=3365059 RepID=UPI0037A5AE13